ncbi:TniQ family protein [Curtobacterium sp. 'Ferrero']|uniref:TniQ family protein n=1 Tax=Curtobacterium sp. 'Ferrero' TaxID=2033654 RepID=UPI0015964979|nr:TniQ family protein [Curtobacterium sp. 'Ferrero']
MPGEHLPSLLLRIAAYVGEPPAAISRWCGLGALRSADRRRLDMILPAEVARSIAIAVGCSTGELLDGMMRSFVNDALAPGDDGLPAHAKNWTRGSGTRYCPQCLTARPAVFLAHWRLWWSFLCETHQVPLHDTCPACGEGISDPALMEAHPVDPSRCRARLEDGSRCGHDLGATWHEAAFDESAPIVRAQAAISAAWKRDRQTLDVFIPDVQHLFRTLRGVGIALLAADDTALIAELAELDPSQLHGLFDETARIGTAPPKNALAMGALMAAAFALMFTSEEEVRPIIRRLTFARPSAQGQTERGPGSAATLLGYWPGVGPRFRGRVLRAIDGDLPAMQRLVTGSAVRAEFDEPAVAAYVDFLMPHDSLRNPTWTADHIPPLLWANWAVPLSVAGGADPETLQRSLALGLTAALAGAYRDVPDHEAIAGIGRRLRPAMLGTPAQTTAILRQLGELARYLAASEPGINYATRQRHLPWWQLLEPTHWDMICASVGTFTGGPRRLLNARRYLYLRATAQPISALPTPWAVVANGRDAAEYTDFQIRMTAQLQIALDAYLEAWLTSTIDAVSAYDRGKGTSPVAVWEPPRWAGREAVHLGPEIDDIEVPALHDLVASGVTTVRALAAATRRTPQHVRWALRRHPVPSDQPIFPIDWSAHLRQIPWQPYLPVTHRNGNDADQDVTVLLPYGWHGARVYRGAGGSHLIDWR